MNKRGYQKILQPSYLLKIDKKKQTNKNRKRKEIEDKTEEPVKLPSERKAKSLIFSKLI